MGSQFFSVQKTIKGSTVKDAFIDAVDEARWEYGNRSYTGTIAEKHGYEEFVLPPGVAISTELIHDIDAVLYDDAPAPFWMEKLNTNLLISLWKDKWEPAIALVAHDRSEVLFCGYASS
jgi:hypothetical protein